MRPERRQAWTELLAANSDIWTFDEQLAVEAALFDDPAHSIRHAVGRYQHPVFEYGSGVAGVLVVASDGARMGEVVREGVTVDSLGVWLRAVALRPSRDDLTCLIVGTTPPPAA